MDEIRTKVQEIALDVACQVNGEDVRYSMAGDSFWLPMIINEQEVIVRFRRFSCELEFELLGVFDKSNRELAGFDNSSRITQQLRTINNLFDVALRRSRYLGFREKELLRKNL